MNPEIKESDHRQYQLKLREQRDLCLKRISELEEQLAKLQPRAKDTKTTGQI